MESLNAVDGLTLHRRLCKRRQFPRASPMELGDWKSASELKVEAAGDPWAQAITWTAIGVGQRAIRKSGPRTEAENTLARST